MGTTSRMAEVLLSTFRMPTERAWAQAEGVSLNESKRTLGL